MVKKLSRPVIFHPILLGVYPILALLAYNLEQIRPEAAARAGVIALAGCLLLYGALRLLLRDTGRAAVLASFWLVLFYTYGHVYQLVEGKRILGISYGKHRVLLGVWLVLFLAGSAWVLKKVKSTAGINLFLNVVSAALVVFPLIQAGIFAYRYQSAALAGPSSVQGGAATTAAALPKAGAGAGDTPDIYYIVLDGYSRADVLKKLYNLDITSFMNELKSIGFVLPECAQSNYAITPFSIFASLNMNYLQAYGSAFPFGSSLDQVQTTGIYEYLDQNEVRRFLEQRGYRTVAFETDWWWLNLTDADTYIVGNNNPLAKLNPGYEVSSFEELFIRTTLLDPLFETKVWLSGKQAPVIRTPNQRRYEVTLFNLDQLEKVPQLPDKKFVYAHIAAPHSPFVFDADGGFVDYDSRSGVDPAYPNEIKWLNKRILQVIQTLISSSKKPPIIILQADHGWDPRYRLQILNAYYLPGGGGEKIYASITPVNTFRLVFDQYFGANYPFLEDKSYFSIGEEWPQYNIKSRPYQLAPVPGSCMGGK